MTIPGGAQYKLGQRTKRAPRDKLGRDSSVFRRKAAALKASEAGGTCWICNDPIDRDLPPSEYNNPRYWTVDHDPPLSLGGSLLTGLKPAHKGCNSSEGGKLTHAGNIDVGWERSRDW